MRESEDLVRASATAGAREPALLWRWLARAAAAYDADIAWLETYALRLFADEQRRRAALEAAPPPTCARTCPRPMR
jgi:hypothetical protein